VLYTWTLATHEQDTFKVEWKTSLESSDKPFHGFDGRSKQELASD
jgi:hypothetical protein